MRAMSLFAGGGIGETYLEDIGIHTEIANEMLKERADIYQYRYPTTNMICGDIKEKKEELIKLAREKEVELLIATPPCQGMSVLGKKDYQGDERNYLIFDVFDIIDALDFNYIFIENVPKFLKMYYPYGVDNTPTLLPNILKDKYSSKYEIKCGVYDAANYKVPQRRKRTIIRMWKKGLLWEDPHKEEQYITLREAIGDLPSLESGEDSGIKWHKASKISNRYIEMLKHVPTGKSAHENPIWYPTKEDGTRVKGFANTYRRLEWDKICPTRTMNSGNVSGSNNVHPGRAYIDERTGETLYSDARTLTLLELLIVTSLPRDIDLPQDTKESVIRDIIGEGVPPKMSKAFLEQIIDNK